MIANPASDAQVRYLGSLLGERDIPGDVRVNVEEFVAAGLDRQVASAAIDELLRLPMRQQEPDVQTDVPEGRYAIERDGVLKFYRVDRPTQGRWAGRVFVSVQASDVFHPIHNPEAKRAILDEIGRDPKAASTLYGKTIGRCGVCGRVLTDNDSISAGIGPICQANMKW